MTTLQASQLVVEVLGDNPSTSLRASQLATEVLYANPNAHLLASQLAVESLYANPNAHLMASQLVVMVLHSPPIQGTVVGFTTDDAVLSCAGVVNPAVSHFHSGSVNAQLDEAVLSAYAWIGPYDFSGHRARSAAVTHADVAALATHMDKSAVGVHAGYSSGAGGGGSGPYGSGTALLSNGGFETGDLTGWTIISGPVSAASVVSAAANGSLFGLSFQSLTTSRISQTIATTAGAHYLLHFQFSGVYAGSSSLLSCYINGVLKFTWSFNNAFDQQHGWWGFAIPFTGSGSDTIEFRGNGTSATYVYFDDVFVVPDANLLTNGSFETGDLTGWTASGNLDYASVSSWGATDGTYTYEVATGSLVPSLLSQTFTTTTGQEYRILFDLVVGQQEAGPNYVALRVNGTVVLTITNLAYQQHTYNKSAKFVGTGNDTITFEVIGTQAYWDIDHVRVIRAEFGLSSSGSGAGTTRLITHPDASSLTRH